MNKLEIRPVTINDLEICTRIEGACFLPAEAASRESIEKRIKLFPQGFFVAELGGAVVGHINSAATYKNDITAEEFKAMVGHEEDGKNIVVFSVAVLPQHRNRGIAGQLLLRFIEQSRSLNKSKIMLICKADLVRYYQKYGFTFIGESTSTHGGSKWYEMHLPLSVG